MLSLCRFLADPWHDMSAEHPPGGSGNSEVPTSIKVEHRERNEEDGRSSESGVGDSPAAGRGMPSPDAEGIAAAPGSPEIGGKDRTQVSGMRLTCNICGMTCASPNVLLVHKRSHTGERPFQCNQCGASFTQKGNLLRHVKLHTGEKPYKCSMCSYACRRRDALSGHLRTHAVGKPHKCSFCGRSYKQRSSLEEHLDRCHSYLQRSHLLSAFPSGPDGGDCNEAEQGTNPVLESSLFSHLAHTSTKRKSSVPQRIVGTGDWPMLLSPHGYNGLSEQAPAAATRVSEPSIMGSMPYPGSDSLRPVIQMHSAPSPDLQPSFPGLYSLFYPRGLANTQPCTRPFGLESYIANSGHQVGLSQLHGDGNRVLMQEDSPGRSGRCPTDGENVPPPEQWPTASPTDYSLANRQRGQDAGEDKLAAVEAPRTTNGWPQEMFRVVSASGEQLQAFRCRHCRVLFLDHVMFTIHMGCHGFRDPFECNVCGHRSHDRYEFSSHMVRGEHQSSGTK
uniref:DNA-binding protein Ikaros-like n=1 Tax=Myxine glutinosa TaxID=7769 RepID=UPI00358EDCF5